MSTPPLPAADRKINFAEPPRPKRLPWFDILEPLRPYRGRWAILRTYSPDDHRNPSSAASTQASALTTGKTRRPAGFQFEHGPIDGQPGHWALFARFVGSEVCDCTHRNHAYEMRAPLDGSRRCGQCDGALITPASIDLADADIKLEAAA